MMVGRLATAMANENAPAATGAGDSKTCSVFEATIQIFEKAATSSPSTMVLAKITNQTIKVINPWPKEIYSNTQLVIGQLVDETWVVVEEPTGGGSSCDFIRFHVDSVGEDMTCSPPVKYAMATVEAYPCGCTSVPGVDSYNQVKVYDMAGCFIFDELDLVGRVGYAKWMVPLSIECDTDEYEGCKWEMVQLCCGDVISPVGTSLQYHTNTDEYGNVTEYCIRMNRVLIRTCPDPTTPSDLCGDGPCPEGDCPEPYSEY